MNYKYIHIQLKISKAMNSLLAIILVVELVTLIWGAVLGCKAACCGKPAVNQVLIYQFQFLLIHILQESKNMLLLSNHIPILVFVKYSFVYV